MSLGRAWNHRLAPKLDQAAQYGFEGIEIFFEDLEYHANEQFAGDQLAAAHDIKRLCDARNLEILVLQPFMHYEGLTDRKEHAARITTFKHWLTIAHALGTDTIQIPSNFLPRSQTTSDLHLIVSDLRKVADLAAAAPGGPIRLAYENLCWGTHVDTWEDVWEIVSRVDRPNFGACLDTFNIAGRIYGDPAADSGKTPDAEEALRASMARLVETFDVRKVFFVQVVDAEKLAAPLRKGHEFYDPDQPARMSWSRNCRLFYGETDRGAYLHADQVLEALVSETKGLGFKGWVSMELFNRSMNEAGAGVPAEHARRGRVAWDKVVEDFNL